MSINFSHGLTENLPACLPVGNNADLRDVILANLITRWTDCRLQVQADRLFYAWGSYNVAANKKKCMITIPQTY